MLDTKGKKFNLFENDNYDKLMKIAEQVFKSAIYKEKLLSLENTFLLLLTGLEAGLSITQALKNIQPLFVKNREGKYISGQFAMNTDAMLALVRHSGLLEEIREGIEVRNGVLTAICTIKRKNYTKESVTIFSMQQAQKAGLTGRGKWNEYPERMLQIRARGFALRDNFADILLGLQHSVEELQDSDMETNLPNEESIDNTSKTFEILENPFGEEVLNLNASEIEKHFENKVQNIKNQEDYEKTKDWYVQNKNTIREALKKETRNRIIDLIENIKSGFIVVQNQETLEKKEEAA